MNNVAIIQTCQALRDIAQILHSKTIRRSDWVQDYGFQKVSQQSLFEEAHQRSILVGATRFL